MYLNQAKHFSPFVGAAISFMPSVKFEAGAFIDDKWGAMVDGEYIINRNNTVGLPKYNVSLSILRKF